MLPPVIARYQVVLTVAILKIVLFSDMAPPFCPEKWGRKFLRNPGNFLFSHVVSS
jgi:hypothetical protein